MYLVKVAHLPLYQRLRALNRPRVIADFNDGLWLPAFQAAGWQDLDAILTTAHGVICENGHVAGYARRHNANVHVVPDSPQLDQFDRQRSNIQARSLEDRSGLGRQSRERRIAVPNLGAAGGTDAACA